MEKILVSIIIVNYNTKELTKNCISSVLRHLSSISIEIIVVDNGSNDSSVEFLKNLFPNIVIISNRNNLGFGHANNIGIENSSGKYILLLNPDTLLIKDIITPFIKFYNTHKHLKIGVLGSLLISKDSDILHSFGNFPFNLKLYFKNYISKREDFILNKIEKNYYSEVDIVVGANMFMERTVFNKFQGFDTNIFLYEEELELQYRMKKSSFISIVLNEKSIIHIEGQSSSSYFKRKCMFLSLCYINKKHLPYFLYLFFRIKCFFYAIIFFKNPKITLKEKVNYLKLTIYKQ